MFCEFDINALSIRNSICSDNFSLSSKVEFPIKCCVSVFLVKIWVSKKSLEFKLLNHLLSKKPFYDVGPVSNNVSPFSSFGVSDLNEHDILIQKYICIIICGNSSFKNVLKHIFPFCI